jgi:hypothetical protein
MLSQLVVVLVACYLCRSVFQCIAELYAQLSWESGLPPHGARWNLIQKLLLTEHGIPSAKNDGIMATTASNHAVPNGSIASVV